MTAEMSEELLALLHGSMRPEMAAAAPPEGNWNNVSPGWRSQARGARYQA